MVDGLSVPIVMFVLTLGLSFNELCFHWLIPNLYKQLDSASPFINIFRIHQIEMPIPYAYSDQDAHLSSAT